MRSATNRNPRKTAARKAGARISPRAAVKEVAPGVEEKKRVAQKHAKSVGLRYVGDDAAGIRRIKTGEAFRYETQRGLPVRDDATLARIRSLAIPPAYRDVWISADPRGHLQAVGYDARGRKQYRYHPQWREVRDANKYDKMIDFAQSLPRVRRATARHLAARGLPKEKVLAAIVRILQKTLIRIGNDEYARKNDSYGLTTLQDKHASIRGKRVVFEFRGKSGIKHEINFEDSRLATIVRKCQELPGEELFQYLDDRRHVRDVTSSDVNEYLRKITGDDFTAKDFRTWSGTVLAARALQELAKLDKKAPSKKNVIAAVEKVAERLGNTRTVCRKCYIHPAVINGYLDGSLAENLSRKAGAELSAGRSSLTSEEAAVLGLLQRSLKTDAKRS